MLHVLEVDAHGLLAVGPARVETNRNVDLGLAIHDAVYAHAAAARGHLRTVDVALHRELVRERALAGLTLYGRVSSAPLVRVLVTLQRRVA